MAYRPAPATFSRGFALESAMDGLGRSSSSSSRSKLGCNLLLVAALLAFCSGGASASLVPALFVFGDSTLDTGNLDYRPNTLHLIRTQELPYGRDFVPPGPTGRASNGKLATDFLADNLGLPSPIDWLEPDSQGQKLLQGTNFAAGGSGILNGTGVTTISFAQQVDAFEKAVHKLNHIMGPEKASRLLASSLVLISTGNNDIFNYVYNPKAFLKYDATSYNKLLLSTLSKHMERIYTLGARKLVILSVGPIGCTPVILSLLDSDGSCIKSINDQVQNLNSGLQSLMSQLRTRLNGINLLYANAYDILYNAIQNPAQYGFKYGNVACCGAGKFHGFPLEPCSNHSEVCSVSDEHVFWDLVHPTQAMYKLITDHLFSDLVKFL